VTCKHSPLHSPSSRLFSPSKSISDQLHVIVEID
jgi:hypothetical protein